MNTMDTIKDAWQPVCKDFNTSLPMRRIAAGEITVAHYKAILRQMFHHTRENPQLQALAAVSFRGRQRQMVKRFFQHATAEIGHDQLALNDLKVLGEDVSQIPYERPLPATLALLGYAFYQVQHLNPIGYLGYLFHLEFTPTQNGGAYMQMLEKIGVPREAMTFLHDHSTIDRGHNKLMETYGEELIRTREDVEAVVYAMKVTGKLYADMIEAACEQADTPQDWGRAGEEVHLS